MTACSTHLVLLPGLVCTEELFAEQIASLRGEVAISVADHTRHDTMSGIARAVLATAPNRFALCGLSMGGYIAFEMVRQASDRIERKVGIVAHEILAAERHSWRISPSRREASSRNSLHARSTSARSLLMLPMAIRTAYRPLILVCDRNASPLASTASSTASLSRSRYSSHACLRRVSPDSAFNSDGRKRKHSVLKGAGASASI